MESNYALLYVCFWKCWLISILHSETIRLEIHGDRGHIQTPNYPASYPLNFTSFWIIRGPRGSILQLNFTDFDVEANKKCLYDYVSIGNSEGQQTSKYCGAKIPPGVTSTSGNFFIQFVSDATTTRRGFKAKWMALRREGGPISTPTQSHSVVPVKCNTRHIITVTDPPCPEPSTETVTVESCHCPPRSSVIKTYAPASSLVVAPPLIPAKPRPLPVRPIVDIDAQNNTVADKCAQERDKRIDDSKTSSNQRLVIILGALAVVFFFTDVLLVVLWCCRYKRRHNDMAHSCRTELPPMELKIVDGKVISSPRRAGPRVKFSDDNCINGKSHGTHECNSRSQFNDGNSNLKGDQCLDLLKDSRYVYQTESSQLVMMDHAE